MVEIIGGGGARSPTAPAKPKPVTSKPVTSPAKAWNDALAQAKANSPQQTVTAVPGESLSSIATSHDDTLPSVEAANPRIQPPCLLEIGQTVALPKKTPAQVVSGVDDSQVKPIITAMANANAANTAQSWNKVKQTTFNMLVANNNAAYPDVSAAAEVKQLNALEPGDSKSARNFAAANNAALAAAKQQWTQMGVTKSQLSPIVNAYDHAKQVTATVNRSLRSPQISHNPASVQKLDEAEQHADTSLSTAIQTSLTNAGTTAARQAGANPVTQATASANAIAERVDNIKSYGPNNAAFKTAVDNAAYDLQVTKPAQQVASTYASKGAAAAAGELKAVTGKAGDPGIALKIMQASQPTIGHIANDMNGLVNSSYGLSPQFGQIYGDLSQSVSSATPVLVKKEKDGQKTFSVGTTAADMVGKSIAAGVPKNLQVTWLVNYYQDAARGAIGNASGSALTFATAAQLKQQGNNAAASWLVGGAADGFQALKAKTDAHLQAFSSTTSTVSELKATWAKFMNQSQMTTATNKYLAANPSVAKKAASEQATISQDGDAVVEAESAWSTYQGKLGGISNGWPKDMSSAAQALTGSGDNAVVFAVSQSTRLNSAIVGTLRSTRSFASAFQKDVLKGGYLSRKFPSLGKSLSASDQNAISLGLSAGGLGLTGLSVASNGGFQWGSPAQAVYSIYSGLGFFKYSGETYSKLAKAGWLKNASSSTDTNSGNTTASKVLKIFGENSENLTDSPAFKALGSVYYGLGAVTDAAEALDDSNTDWVPTLFNSAEALGNVGNAATPIVEELGTEALAADVGSASTGIGLVAAAAITVWQMQSAWKANDAYRGATAAFLQGGLGINPQFATQLANMTSNTSAALQQYATAYNTTPGNLLKELNKQWNEGKASNVEWFLYEASRMPVQSDGTYARTQPLLDGERNGSEQMQIVRNDKVVTVPEPLTADSLDQLNYWSDVLFGNNAVG